MRETRADNVQSLGLAVGLHLLLFALVFIGLRWTRENAEPAVTKRFAFGPFLFDAARGTLTRDGQALTVGQRGLRILQTLLDLPLTGEVDQTTWNLIQEAYEEALAENNNGEEAYGDLLDVTYINRTISMTETVLCAGNCGTPLD